MPAFGTLKYPSLGDALYYVILTHFGHVVINLESNIQSLEFND
ncbi:hypothetical protein GXM_04314 [Nostoc sphaeroides CCNUC1]|uniref:Uncharacterized protein n=1 Tax=Nostoc sphaeroides CCNUC1 TaxID=2653204 RepID=A0A5P8W2B2_9NOSO|nr:hypothetical protein GXM_04314 [Nostoc sphaeroides CCNUC1]